jgi:hypothetical protein
MCSSEALADWIFNTLSVIFARSTLVSVISSRASMSLQMVQVGILGRVLPLVRHMDQEIETIAVRIAVNDRHELLLVKRQYLMHRVAKGIQETSALLAIHDALCSGQTAGSHGSLSS